MAKITYDVSNVEDMPERTPAPVGVYRAKIVKAEPKESSKGNQMIEVQYRLTHDGAGKKLKEEYGDLWDYPILDHDHPFVQARLKEFIAALGLKGKGTLDTDKMVGKSVQVKLKSDTDQDGEYRPRVGKVMALPSEDIEEPEEDEPEVDDADDDEDDGEEELDLEELSRKELKALIEEEELDIKVKKSMTDDDIRAAIAEALGDDEDDDEKDEADTEDEDDESEEEEDNYDELSLEDLKAELKERELNTSGAKKVLIARLRKDDTESPF